jgi:hypothetical protein
MKFTFLQVAHGLNGNGSNGRFTSILFPFEAERKSLGVFVS